MAEDNSTPKTDYGSNSAKSKSQGTPESDRPVIKQIASGTTRKAGIGTKFKETFMGDSAESVGQYVLFDVIVPRLKDLLFDTISGGLERSLFGSSMRSSRANRSQLVNKTDYKGISAKRNTPVERERDITPHGRATHNFDEVIIGTRGEAEQIRDTLAALADEYESATVADFYNSVGLTADHTDLKFGWTDLSSLSISPARGGGYILEFPRVEQL